MKVKDGMTSLEHRFKLLEQKMKEQANREDRLSRKKRRSSAGSVRSQGALLGQEQESKIHGEILQRQAQEIANLKDRFDKLRGELLVKNMANSKMPGKQKMIKSF